MRRLPLRSPPRMRGKDTIITELANVLRITPACAGKSRCAWLAACHRRDHPRVCGEKSWTPALCAGGQGSPPRVRGKVTQHLLPALCCGITPACAGKRCRPEYRNGGNQDHPRVCGEKLVPCRCCCPVWGSPPRVRGKATHVGSSGRATGITPACAGKSSCFLG